MKLKSFLYYEEKDPDIKIYCGDARELLPHIPQHDLTIADPPHDRWGEFLLDYPTENMIAFMNFRNLKDFLNKYGTPKAEIIWWFRDGRFLSNNLPRFEHESIMIYGKPASAFVGEENDDKTPVKKGKGCLGSDKNPGDRTYTPRDRKMLSSVIEVPKNMNKSHGVWGKPTGLMVSLIEWFDNMTVLDPFLGSGTTLVACKELDRRGTGIEIDEKSCEVAKRRLLNTCKPMFKLDKTPPNTQPEMF